MKTDKTDKMKTKEEILIKCRSYVPLLDYCATSDALKAMQEHTDQAIAEYKLKLKEAIEPIPHGDGYLPYQDVIELIDTTI